MHAVVFPIVSEAGHRAQHWACGSPPSGVLKRRLLPDLGTDRRCQGSGTLPARAALTSPYRCARSQAARTDTAPSDGKRATADCH